MKDMKSFSPENTKVSVIIPCYNHQEFVGEAIMSVMEQDYDNIELIVIDDGSADNSFEVIKKLGECYGFYYERQDNMGLVKTLNKGMGICSGDFIRILASDDKYHPNTFNCLIEKMRADSSVMAVFSNGCRIRDNKPVVNLYDPELIQLLKGNSINMQNYFLTNMSRVFIQSGVFRRELLDAVNGFDEHVKNDDWVFLIKAFNFIVGTPPYKHQFVDVDGIAYRSHGNNASSETMEMIEMIHEVIENFIPDQHKKTLLANVYWNSGVSRFKQKVFGDAISLLIKSQRYELSISRPAKVIERGLKKLMKH